jgi:VWFA-related protein
MRRRSFLITAASFCAAILRAQEEPTFTARVKVVNVLATVRDKKGAIIRDLTKDDFSLLEDKRPQNIRYFAKQSDLPLTIGLMVDTSMSQQRVLDAERGASYRFLDQVLRERKDQVFIMQFDMSVQMRQGLTDSRKKLDDALDFVDTPTRNQLRTVGSGGGTLLYDALVKASKDPMKALTGRKALIVMTDGVDYGSEETVSSAIDAAQKADTLIYCILFSDSGFYGGGGPDGKGVLMRMAKETGGGFFAVSKKQSIEDIFGLIQDELRSQYSLGYVSDQPVSISEFRKIQLAPKDKTLIVQSRDKYWAQP